MNIIKDNQGKEAKAPSSATDSTAQSLKTKAPLITEI